MFLELEPVPVGRIHVDSAIEGGNQMVWEPFLAPIPEIRVL